jgi:hypothetical protein
MTATLQARQVLRFWSRTRLCAENVPLWVRDGKYARRGRAARQQFTRLSPALLLPHAMRSGPAALDAPSPCAERNQDVQTALRYGLF